ncbi:hypothetical protein ACX1NX_02915 [Acinetobacter sp. ANC 5383]
MDENEQRKFLFATSAIDIPKAVDGQKRTFKGVAYSGGRIDGHWFWGRDGVVIDLDGIDIPTPIPLLGEHDTDSRIGVVTAVSTIQGISVEGNFLSNPEALEFVQDSDDGFPFQMSIMVDPGSTEEVAQGETINVNGQNFNGPITVFRKNRIREFTICSTGADRNTSIKAFSGKPSHQPKQEDTDVIELEKAQARINELEKELNEFKANKRTEDIAKLEADLKTQFSAEDKTAYASMDEAMFSFTAKQMRQFSGGQGTQPEGQQQTTPQPNPAFVHLFSHQANGGQGNQGGGQQEEKHRLTTAAEKFAANAAKK